MRLRRAALAFLPLLAYTALAALYFRNAWAAPHDLTAGGHGDPEASIWYYAWIQHALAHGNNPLLTDFLNYPQGVNLAAQTSQPLAAVVSWPVSAIFGPYAAYDAVVTAALALSAWCAYLAIRRWVPRRSAAFAGGLLYGFSPYMATHAQGHANLLLAFVPPLLLLALDEALVRRRWPWWRSGAVLGVLGTVQLYLTEEILATSAILAATGAVALVLFNRDRWRAAVPYAVRALALGAALVLALGAPLLYVQFHGPNHLPGIFQKPGGFSTDLFNFVVPTGAQQVSPGIAERVVAHFSGNGAERNGYLSIPLLLILAYTLWRFRHLAIVRVMGVVGAVAAVLSMGPTLRVLGVSTHIPLPWVVFAHLPLFGNIIPSRIMLYAFLAAALLVAVFVDHVVRSRGAVLAAGGLALAAALVLLLPSLDFLASPHADPAFFRAGGDAQRIPEGASVLLVPFVNDPAVAESETWQVISGMRFRVPSGYFLARDPNSADSHLTGPLLRPLSRALVDIVTDKGGPALTDSLVARMRDDLRYWRTQVVVLGPAPHAGELVELLTTVLGRPPQQDQGAQVWWNVQPPGQPAVSDAATLPTSPS